MEEKNIDEFDKNLFFTTEHTEITEKFYSVCYLCVLCVLRG